MFVLVEQLHEARREDEALVVGCHQLDVRFDMFAGRVEAGLRDEIGLGVAAFVFALSEVEREDDFGIVLFRDVEDVGIGADQVEP